MTTNDPKHDPFADPTFAHVPTTPAPTPVGAPPARGPGYGALFVGGGMLLLGGAGLFGGGVLTGALLSRPMRPDSPWVPPVASIAPPPVVAVPAAPTPTPTPTPPVEVVGPQVAVTRPRIEVVFAMDTTGSMGGLLKAAKQKVWSIVDQLSTQLVIDPVSGELVRPRIALGLVAYRDQGDEYVTRSVPLTEDIDSFREALAALHAAGGGDEPEAVSDAVRAAIELSMGWSPIETPGRARVLFVLGDAPGKDTALSLWSREAFLPRERGIHVDAVLCGANAGARSWFESLVSYPGAGGTVLQVDQRPQTVALSTPHDEAIARVQRRIEATVVAYGDGRSQERTLAQWSSNGTLDAEAYATRSSAQCKTGRTYDGDLLQALDDGRVKLADVTPAQVSRQELVVNGAVSPRLVEGLRAERDAARAELTKLVTARDAWIKANPTDAASLDQQLLRTLRGHLIAAGLVRGGC